MDPRILQEASRIVEEGDPFALCVVVEGIGSVPAKEGAAMIVLRDGTSRGTVGGAGLEERVKALALEAIQKGRGGVHTFDLASWKKGGLDSVCGGTVTVAIHVVLPPPRILLVGGGHCSLAMAQVADVLGWRYDVVDSRPDYASRERFPQAVEVHSETPSLWIRSNPTQRYTHVLVLGHNHHEDVETLVALAQVGYTGIVGVIGSLSKRTSLWERAEKRGVSREFLERVRCPVGEDVGGITPAEIAISMAQQIIRDVRQKKDIHVEVRTTKGVSA